ncbi:MAG: zinc ribbon domain-containing protein [Deltaproteobacteria bacterium]
MRILCPNCNTADNVDDKKIPEAGAYVKCKNCDIMFSINKNSGEVDEKQKADEAFKAADEASERKKLDKREGINSTLYCSNCGKQIPDESKYCSHCGTLINKEPEPEPTPDYKNQIPLGSPIKDFTESALTKHIGDPKEISDDTKEHTEFGFWDHKVEIDNGQAKLTEIMKQHSESTISISTRCSELNAKLLEIHANHPVDARKAQMLCRAFAESHSDYAKKVSELNFEHDKMIKRLGPSLEYIYGQVPSSEDQRTKLANNLAALAVVENSLLTAKATNLRLIETLEQMPIIERKLTLATLETCKALRHFAINFDQSLVMYSRVRCIGEQVLRQVRAEAIDKTMLFVNKDFTEPALTKQLCDQKEVEDGPKELAELGWLDHKVEVDKGFAKLSEIIQQLTKWIELISTRRSEENAKLMEIYANPLADARKLQLFCRTFAEFLFDYAKKVSEANLECDNTLKRFEISLEYWVSGLQPSSKEAHTQLANNLAALANLEDIILTTKAPFLRITATLNQIPNMEQTLTMGIHGVSKELKRLDINFDRMTAIFSRARGIGERVLRQARTGAIEKISLAEPSATAG